MFALSSRETLTHEINQKYYSVKERDQTSRKKKAWCESLECCIKELYPSSRLVLVGSSASGFAIEGCDVDLTLVRQGRQVFYRLDSDVEVLRKIRDRLATRRSSVITEVYSILISFTFDPVTTRPDKLSSEQIFDHCLSYEYDCLMSSCEKNILKILKTKIMRNVSSINFGIVSLIFSVMGHEIITTYSLKQIPWILLDKTECFFFYYYHYLKKSNNIYLPKYTRTIDQA